MDSNPDHRHGGEPPADVVLDEAYWDERYRASGRVWSGRPNAQLVAEAASLRPGTALDVGCGEGGDALWLAAHGWQVTATDISRVALERAAAHARDAGPDVAARISWVHTDLTRPAPPGPAYDLVSAQFLHVPPAERDALHRRLAASVAPGGTLLVVGHHPSDLQTGVRRPPLPGLLFAAEDVAAVLDADAWDIVVSESRPRAASDPDGRPVTVHDAVLRATRRAGVPSTRSRGSEGQGSGR